MANRYWQKLAQFEFWRLCVQVRHLSFGDILVHITEMGIDKRGIKRRVCNNCSHGCKDFEADIFGRCGYCGCILVHHEALKRKLWSIAQISLTYVCIHMLVFNLSRYTMDGPSNFRDLVNWWRGWGQSTPKRFCQTLCSIVNFYVFYM